MEKCFFRDLKGECGAISGRFCDGYNKKCSFYKTERQFIMDRNAAIMKNRRKGNCANCKYSVFPCTIIPVKPIN